MIKTNHSVTATVQITLTEGEARALDALAGYGGPAAVAALEAFYAKCGKHYMEPYENDFLNLLDKVRKVLPDFFRRCDEARAAFCPELKKAQMNADQVREVLTPAPPLNEGHRPDASRATHIMSGRRCRTGSLSQSARTSNVKTLIRGHN